MAEVSNILNKLFVQGLTREQFIAKFKELSKSSEEGSSIFSSDIDDEAIGLMFDSFHTSASAGNKDKDVITAEDIKKLSALDGDDSSISLDDFSKIYENALNTKQDISISNRRNLLIQKEHAEEQKVQQEIANLEQKKKKNEQTVTKEAKNKETELKKSKKSLKEKQDLLKEIEEQEQELNEKKKQLSQETDENKKQDLNNEIQKLQSQISSKSSISTEIKRLTDFIEKCEKFDADEELQKLNDPIDTEIKKKQEEITVLKKNLELDLEDLLADDIKAQEANAKAIAAIKDYKSGTRYDNVAGSFNSSDINFLKNGSTVNGVKYSAEKGQKLAKDVASHSVGFTGHCAGYVSNGLSRTGLSNGKRGDGADMDTVLDSNKNFKKISVSSANDLKNLPAGCVLVYERGAAGYSSKYGHVEVTLGDGTAASDGRTRNLRYSQNMSVYVPVDTA